MSTGKTFVILWEILLSTNRIEDSLFLTKTNDSIIDKILLSLQLILHNIILKIKIEKKLYFLQKHLIVKLWANF
jgi:hypothetical protein